MAMKLVPCPACGRQLSPEALSCPKCGHPLADGGEESPTNESTLGVERIENFNSSATEIARGGGLGPGCSPYFYGIVALIVFGGLGAAIAMPLVYIGFAIFVYFNLASIYYVLFGKFHRAGKCPHCETKTSIVAVEDTSMKCPGCGHRLILRGERLYDVSASD